MPGFRQAHFIRSAFGIRLTELDRVIFPPANIANVIFPNGRLSTAWAFYLICFVQVHLSNTRIDLMV